MCRGNMAYFRVECLSCNADLWLKAHDLLELAEDYVCPSCGASIMVTIRISSGYSTQFFDEKHPVGGPFYSGLVCDTEDDLRRLQASGVALRYARSTATWAVTYQHGEEIDTAPATRPKPEAPLPMGPKVKNVRTASLRITVSEPDDGPEDVPKDQGASDGVDFGGYKY